MVQGIDPQYLCHTGRYAKLAKLEAYFGGTQYDDRKSWYDDASDVPLRERAPCVVYPLPKAAVNQATRFTIGEGKFPKLKVEEIAAEDAFAPQFAVSEDEAEALGQTLDDVVKRSKLRSVLRTTMRRGISCGTGAHIMSVDGGRFHFEHPRAKDCIPRFKNDAPEQRVESLIWSYHFEREEPDDKGRPTTARYAFRRDYDAVDVVEYEEERVESAGKPIVWREKSRTPHKLGFCPVIWTRNLPDECGSDIDGVSIFDGLLDELDALNFALSQRHTGLEVLGTPQPFETGVAPGDGPAATARTAAPEPTDKRAPTTFSRAGAPTAPRGVPARRAGAKYIWTYESDAVQLGLMETTGKAFEVASSHVMDIRSRLLEAMDVILLDPTTVAGKGDMSAKALALMYAPMLALVDELREWWWDHCIWPTLSMMLRAVSVLGDGMLVKGAKAVKELLRKRSIDVDGETVWEPPDITPLWGAYFAPSAEDVLNTTRSAALAKKHSLISPDTATRYVASDFAVQSVPEETEAIAKAAQPSTTQATATPGDDLEEQDRPEADPLETSP